MTTHFGKGESQNRRPDPIPFQSLFDPIPFNMICKSNPYRRFVLICAFASGALSCSTPGQTERTLEATPRETNSSVRDVSTPVQDTMMEYRNTSRVHSFDTF